MSSESESIPSSPTENLERQELNNSRYIRVGVAILALHRIDVVQGYCLVCSRLCTRLDVAKLNL